MSFREDVPTPSGPEDYNGSPHDLPFSESDPYQGRDDWKSLLIIDKNDRPLSNLANAASVLRHAPELAGRIAYDEFHRIVVVREPLPWDPERGDRPWEDNDDRHFAEWCQRRGLGIPVRTASDAADAVASERKFHPVRDYLRAREWDSVPRLPTILPAYFGAADSPYVRAVGEKWMISAVARILDPGCKADCMLVAEGPQGAGKSRGFASLAEPWFTDRLSDFKGKEAAQELSGAWVVEIAEMDGFDRAAISTVKAFLSRTEDRYRPAYGRRVEEHPRQCVFVGTVNPEDGYLRDPTGARRFWPVACGEVQVEDLQRDRDQLWAEAVAKFDAGVPWHLDTPDLELAATEQQRDRLQTDPWDELVETYLGREATRQAGAEVSIAVDEVLRAMRLDTGRWTQADQSRVARCLVARGYKRTRVTISGRRKWRYVLDGVACPTSPTA